MAIFLLSLAGFPPLAGFFGKFYLFSAAFGAGENHGLLWLVALALLGSLVSLYYYLMVLKAIFLDPAPAGRPAIDAGIPAEIRPRLPRRDRPFPRHHARRFCSIRILAALTLSKRAEAKARISAIVRDGQTHRCFFHPPRSRQYH